VEPSTELQAFTRRWIAAMNGRHLDTIVNLFANDPLLLVIGSDPDEWIVGYDTTCRIVEAQAQEFEAQDVAFVIADVEAYSEGTVGWVAARLGTRLHGRPSPSMRFTAVAHLERGDWRFVQMHMSYGSSNEDVLGFEMTTVEHLASRVQSERPDLRSSAAPDGTVTIIFSDIEGSTDLATRLGDHKWLELLRWHDGVVAAQTDRQGGRVVKSLGDGHMIAFPSARSALHAAIGVQQSFQEPRDGSLLKLRIGLHTGEVLREADDFYGRAVIMAARVAAQAHGNEILASSVVVELTQSLGFFEFGEPRSADLKGLPGTHQLFPVLWRAAP